MKKIFKLTFWALAVFYMLATIYGTYLKYESPTCAIYGEIREYKTELKFVKNEMTVNEAKIPRRDQRVSFTCACYEVENKINLCQIEPTIYKKEK